MKKETEAENLVLQSLSGKSILKQAKQYITNVKHIY
jgi:hypothetical protein